MIKVSHKALVKVLHKVPGSAKKVLTMLQRLSCSLVMTACLFVGHDCLLYLISIGKDPRQFSHTKADADKMAVLPSVEEAQQRLAVKNTRELGLGQPSSFCWVAQQEIFSR